MCESSAQTVREIEDVSNRLDGELREFEDRMPPMRTVKRVAAGLLTGTTGTVTFWMIRRRRKSKKKKQESPGVQAVVQVMPDRWAKQVAESLQDGTWQRPAAYAAGAYLIFKLAELRQLRRTNKLLAARG
jgi:hypothetical protein